MKDKIEKIRNLLDEMENWKTEEFEQTFQESFDLFELPEIIKSIIDYLQPLLLSYEYAIYWYIFRHSIIENGDNHIRVSTRGLNAVIKSSSGKSDHLSYSSVQDALKGLENKGALRKYGDTNREGTLYKIFLPEEIEICLQRMKEVVIEDLPKIDPKKETDYYNIKDNRLKIFERDNYKCYKCGKQLTRFSVTLDHIQPVSKGGDNSYDNLVTCCLHCNSKRRAMQISEFFTS